MHRAPFLALASLLVVSASTLAACDDETGGAGGGGGSDAASTGTGDTSASNATTTGASTGSGGTTEECTALCDDSGYGVGLVEDDACFCEEPQDAACQEGMEAVCGCAAEDCDGATQFALYSECFRSVEPTREFVLCVGSFTAEDGLTVDCGASEEACDWPE